MRIVVVGGAGAMGAVWATRLAAGGADVAILDVSPPALEAIARDGLVVERKDGATEATRLPASADPAALGQPDAVLFFTKSYHTRSAAELAAPLVGPETTVASLQNGWGNSDILAETFPAERMVMGVTYHSATVRGPGRIAHTNDAGPTFLGPFLDGGPLDRAETLAAAMRAGGIAATVTADAKTEVWKKLILNCATLPVAALSRLYSGEMGKPGPVRDLLDTLAREATAVARALGREIDPAERVAAIHALLSTAGKGKASMLQDAEAKRTTEIDVVNGAVVREGERLGVPVPVNRAMVALVKGMERAWRQDD
jgi:2-dehydropantoate 2-reductase